MPYFSESKRMSLCRSMHPSGTTFPLRVMFAIVLAGAFCAPLHAHPGGELRLPGVKPVMTYGELVKDTRRLASDRNELVDAVVARRIRLSLKPFGGGSDAFFANRRDSIGFICHSKPAGFKGGEVEAMIINHENESGEGDFYTLDACQGSKQMQKAVSK